jgi:hypothetical protein
MVRSISPESESEEEVRTPPSTLILDRIELELDRSPREPCSYNEKYNHPFLDFPQPSSMPKDHILGEEKEDPEDVSLIKINILHSAILESEDEAGYRQFIGEVAGGTVGLGFGIGG